MLDINIIWDYSKPRFIIFKNLKIIKNNNIDIKSLNRYDAIR